MTAAPALNTTPSRPAAAVVPAIEIKSVTKSYPGQSGKAVYALGPVDLRIDPGSFVSVVGPSGCGKSTLLRLVAGLEMPDGGTMQRYGTPLNGPSHEVGIVFQEHVLFPWATVLDNVLLPAEVLALPKAAARERALKLLDLTGLKDFAHQRPQALSGGMKQRAAFCRAMISDPRLLLLDEPFGALDAKVREDLRAWLRRLHDEVHVTTVLVTHDQAEALDVADRIAVLNKGRIEQVGSPTQVYDSPTNAFVMSFLG
ncbi:MAG: Nitrate/sulfonate/bicarbonate transporter ATP-binding protein, partial [Tardiphaga sp.]|nr:Nitrate/sulfonate/bicarbonate transporter ATP-binding protein [Tardiphaga sp.]